MPPKSRLESRIYVQDVIKFCTFIKLIIGLHNPEVNPIPHREHMDPSGGPPIAGIVLLKSAAALESVLLFATGERTRSQQ